jgi:hypothetical protein
MSPEFAAAVLEGFMGTLNDLFDRELPSEARCVLVGLR